MGSITYGLQEDASSSVSKAISEKHEGKELKYFMAGQAIPTPLRV